MKWLPFVQTWSTERRHKTRSKPHAKRTAMEHIAIDLGSRESQICIRNDAGEILEEKRYPTTRLGLFLAKRDPGGRVLLETSSEAFAIADLARDCGHEV